MPDRDDYLASTDWLAEHLEDPGLRVIECTVFLRPREHGGPGYAVVSGREEWERAHIPGSDFIELQGELSDTSSPLRFMMPSAERFAAAMSRHGVGNDSRVVLYDRQGNMWAARVWWMLRAFGFDGARVLDGGWTAWLAQDRPTSTQPAPLGTATFVPRPRTQLIATKEDVLASIESGRSCIVNALSAAQHRGEVAPYGRPGHISGSVNVPAMGSAGIVDPKTQLYQSTSEIRRRFEEAGAKSGERMITYCGGGIAASSAAFAALMAGYTDVAVYDASLSEWAVDPSLPMATS